MNRVHDHINYDDKTMVFLTKQQMKILEGSFPPDLWIRGPAGSGKTYLLIEKAVTLAKGILSDPTKANGKILVLCFNSVLCKSILQGYKRKLPEGTNVRSFLHCVTFTKLVMELAGLSWAPYSNDDKESSVNLAVEKLNSADVVTKMSYMYDHILVDEGQDLYGEKWPELLRHMHKNSYLSDDDLLAKAGNFWVMFDMNQYLYFAKEQAYSRLQYLRNSALLDKVFRNTKNVFEQSKKYFSDDALITLGHAVSGLQIHWEASLFSRSVDDQSGAQCIVQCIGVIESIGVKSQTGDDLVEKSVNYVVLESIRRFKGMESKVVILYNPPYEAYQVSNCTRELLYTAVSRCSCLLVVITTEEGCQALQSNVGMNQ